MTRLRAECILCLTGKQMAAFPQDAAEEDKLNYMQRVLRMIADAPHTEGAPVLLHAIRRLQREMFGSEPRDYTQIKQHFNQLMLLEEDAVRRRIAASVDPLCTAIQYAMIGNYIDFGAKHHVSEDELSSMMAAPERYEVNREELEQLRADLARTRQIVLLTDNCGEIVLDKLLLETLHSLYPDIRMNAIVRGQPAGNDATVEDALQTGLPEHAHVIGNGSGIQGTCLTDLSEQARELIENAGVVIAKGQANFETLNGCGYNIYYLFLCKCEMFARRFDVPMLSGIMVNDLRM